MDGVHDWGRGTKMRREQCGNLRIEVVIETMAMLATLPSDRVNAMPAAMESRNVNM